MNLRAAYVPTGPAAEYADLAFSPWKGCVHGCLYCYGPASLRVTVEQFRSRPVPRWRALRGFEHDCQDLRAVGDHRRILMAFSCDPYPEVEAVEHCTRCALTRAIAYGRPVTILTKGGTRVVSDFPLIVGADVTLGTSLVWDTEHLRQQWESNAASIADRYAAMNQAIGEGIFTWVSVEPVMEPKEALLTIEGTAAIGVQHWKVGKINHRPELEQYVLGDHDRPQDWPGFCRDLWALMQRIGPEKFYVKRSLQGYMPEGWWHGG